MLGSSLLFAQERPKANIQANVLFILLSLNTCWKLDEIHALNDNYCVMPVLNHVWDNQNIGTQLFCLLSTFITGIIRNATWKSVTIKIYCNSLLWCIRSTKGGLNTMNNPNVLIREISLWINKRFAENRRSLLPRLLRTAFKACRQLLRKFFARFCALKFKC